MNMDFKIAFRHRISENDLLSSDRDVKNEDTHERNAAFPLLITALCSSEEEHIILYDTERTSP
jgi:hypothetical protein